MRKGMFVMALAAAMTFTATGIAFAAGSIGHGNIGVYKGDQLADKLSGQNPIEEGALLVCDGKCMIKSEGISLVAADQAKLAIRNDDQAFNLYLREGQVNYTITNNTRQIAFHTPQGTYTTAEVIFNADSNPVVRGYALVNQDGSTEIGVEEGRLVFATADGMKTVDANHKIILAVSEVGAAAGAGTGSGTAAGSGAAVGAGAGAGAAAGGAAIGGFTTAGLVTAGVVTAGVVTTAVVVANNDDDDPVSSPPSAPESSPAPTQAPASTPNPTPSASPNV